MREQLSKFRARYEPAAKRALEASKCAFDVTSKATIRGLAVTGRTLKRGTNAVLGGLEAVLLSPSGRERVHAVSTFALIFMFAVTSVDFLIGGGPDFGTPAQAAPRPQLVRVEPGSALAQAAPAPRTEEFIPTEVSATFADATGASVIPVSQSFAPARRSPSASSTPASAEPDVLADAPAPDAAVTEEAPRKHQRVKGEAA